MITNKTKQHYPELEGAEYLEYESALVPPGVKIMKNNVVVSKGGKLKLSRFEPMWGWSADFGFCSNFASPEAALENYFQTTNWFKKG